MEPERDRARIVARLLREGGELVRHGAEHDLYRHAGRPLPAIIPRHRTLSPGVARSIAKVAGWR